MPLIVRDVRLIHHCFGTPADSGKSDLDKRILLWRVSSRELTLEVEFPILAFSAFLKLVILASIIHAHAMQIHTLRLQLMQLFDSRFTMAALER